MRALPEFVEISELNRFGRTRLGAGRCHPILLAVITQRAFPGSAVVFSSVDYSEGTVYDAVATAIADIRLNIDTVELGSHDRAGGTAFEAARAGAVLTNIGGEQPRECARILRRKSDRPLNKRDVPPGGCS